MSAPRAFYVYRVRPDGKIGYTGAIRSAAQADREAAAWAEAGWYAEVLPTSPEVKVRIRCWEKAVRSTGTQFSKQIAAATCEAQLAEHGYQVLPLDCGFGPVKDSWVLLDPDGDSLQIENWGGVSGYRWAAVAEGLRRIAADRKAQEAFDARQAVSA